MTPPRHTNYGCSSSRRDVLRWGTLSALGLGCAERLRLQATAHETASIRAKSCILLWLDGGPSHLETWDMKPAASAEVRGPFSPIVTKTPGIHISELLPLTAQKIDHVAIIRSLTSPLGEHGLANRYLLTGYRPSPVLEYPSYGSVVSHMRNRKVELPPYIAIPNSRSAGAGYLGSQHDPFHTEGDPAKADFAVRDLDFFPGLTAERVHRRQDYLRTFDAVQSAFESQQVASDTAFAQAYRMTTSVEAKRAFRIEEEPIAVRERYGSRTFGQSCLLARRLVERGVPFVTVYNSGWDTHENLTLSLRDGYAGAKVGVGLVPTFDLGFSALIGDLAERGMLQETLVIAMGEFGRTPKLNQRGGRDHWPRVFSCVLAGAGIRGGQVIGSSDKWGESPSDNPVTPADLAFTIYTLLGIDPQSKLVTSDGRPVALNQGGRMIAELA
ncbi:MAG: DUF1501 domain-containing protein [Planctomycetales bacterium]|nr:DUF1501 domain-containing protein [Planctomycetales bacterium]